MASHVKCAVFNCNSSEKGISLHRFPNPKTDIDRYLNWVRATGNLQFQDAMNINIYEKYRICGKHFRPEDFTCTKRIRRNVLPTLFLPNSLHIDMDIDYIKKDSKIDITPPKASEQAPPTSLLPSVSMTLTPSPKRRKYTDAELEPLRFTDEHRDCHLDISQAHTDESTATQISSKNMVKRRRVLSRIGVRSLTQLTTNERIVYKQLQLLARKYKSQKYYYGNKMKLAKARKISKNAPLQALIQNLTPFQFRFFESQVRNASRQRKGRIYTFKDKTDAIALWKTSPRMYKLLCHLFALPSVTTLRKILSKIYLRPGIHEAVFEILKNRFSKSTVKNRLCTLIFDEMALQPHLEYCCYNDEVIGFENDGSTTSSEIADHVTVFMLRGILKPWKQPVAYAFCKSTMASATIAYFYKEIARQVNSAGLILLASVCDQGTTNVRALDILLEESKRSAILNNVDLQDGIILIDNIEVIPIFDSPHLMKSLRNNLVTKNLTFMMNNIQYTAKWEHILNAYTIDKSYNIGILKKLTDFHVVPNKIKKMKVSFCTQVFSESAAAGVKFCAIFNAKDKDRTVEVPNEGTQTAELMLFLDKVFDSLNSTFLSVPGKELKGAVTRNSAHAKFWRSAINIFQSMEFIPRKAVDRVHPPVLKGWLRTLNGFLLIQSKCLSLGVTKFSSRSFNQDPIENFFCQVRQYGYRNINPTCAAFGPYYKSLLIKHFASQHPNTSNCEADDTSMAIEVNQLLAFPRHAEVPGKWHPLTTHVVPDVSHAEASAVAYVSGYLSKTKILSINNCNTCKKNFIHSGPPDEYFHKFISFKERFRDEEHLIYTNVNIIKALIAVYDLLNKNVPTALHINFLVERLCSFVQCYIPFLLNQCEHTENIKKILVKNFVKLYVYTYLKKLNNIVNGKCKILNPNDLEEKMLKLSRFR